MSDMPVRDSDVRFLGDSVEKILDAVRSNFLRAAGAFCAVRHGGPHQPEQNLSATFFFA
jgi:hypothetical protein